MPRRKQKTTAGSRRPKTGAGKSVKASAKPRWAKGAKAKVIATVEIVAAVSDESSPALMLPDCLDSSAAAAVKSMLLARRGNALVVDASQVRRVGTQSLQILVAAARTWKSDGHNYCVANSSSEFLDTIALIGLSREDLRLEGSCP
jgi:chemotaxis protein CheX